MRIVNFAEGATPQKGGIGIVGIPVIMASTAARGHRIVVLMGGPPIPGRDEFRSAGIDDALNRIQGAGTFGIVTHKAWGAWAFSPTLLWKAIGVVRRSDFIGLHSLYSFPVLVGYTLARCVGRPYGIWLHGVLAPCQRRVSARKKWLYDRLFARRILAHAAVIFFTARGEREETRCLGLTTPSVVVPTGFIVEEYSNLPSRGAFRARFLAGHTGPLVLCLARLNAKKGLDLLAEAMALVAACRPDVRLAIVGPPDPPSFGEKVREWIQKNGIESSAVITGPVDPAMKLQALADTDVLVMPSEAENFGFSVFEAMSSRIPVVVSDTLNYAEEIAASGAGFAVHRQAGQLAGAILRLVDNPALRQQMGLNGLEMANRYSWEKTGAKVERVIQSVLIHQPLPADLAN
jgi:glycosyltransferase involved in cell wall biosynthesis